MTEEELLKKLREAFKSEAEERLAEMSSGLLELEKTSKKDKAPVLEKVFREAHSLKGAARAVNVMEFESLCQAIESVFSTIKQDEIALSPEQFDLLHSCVGAMETFLTVLDEEETLQNKEEMGSLLHQLQDLKPATGRRVEDRDEMPKDRRRETEDKWPDRRERPEEDVTDEEKPIETDEAPREAKLSQTRPLLSETVRISTSKLDSLLLKAEELVALKLMSSQHLADLQDALHLFDDWKKRWNRTESELRVLRKQAQNKGELASLLEFLDWNQEHLQSMGQKIRTLKSATEQDQRTVGSMVDGLLDSTKEAAMLPFAILFAALPRMVRELSRDQGKEVDLVLEGEEVEIDRRILEQIKDPLIHLLRNAVDHGIEDPERRVEGEKPRCGTINLSITQAEGGNVEILLSDDGGGIDLARVKKKAVESGILSQKEVEHLEDQEAISLIFRSGVSTSRIITEISGRGLGLAIVQENVEKLGGLLSMETNPGKGTAVSIQLPVTLATFRGVLVEAADRFFVVPSSHVERIARIRQNEIKTVENRTTILLDGRVVSFLELAHVLEISYKEDQKDERAFVTVLVLGAGEKRIAFKVDEVLSEQEVLVKGLGKQLSRVPNIAGATILGSGKVVPILSAQDLLKTSLEAITRVTTVGVIKGEEEAGEKSILVVEDSITSRMLIKNILEAAGYLVKTAVDGQDAYSTLKTEAFDLVVSDVEMPKMDGFELTTKIRSDKRLAETPVVLVTSLESREDQERGIDVGANAYIVKRSFDQSNLLDVIGRLI